MLVSSGAIAAGLAPLGLKARPRDLATQQAAASVGQGLLMRAYTESFGRHGRTVGQVLLTVDDVIRRTHYRNAYRTLRRLLDLRTIPIVNENDTVATEEIRFGDNDRLAALVAALVHADLLMLLSDVDALYTGDPSQPDSRRIDEVRSEEDLAGIAIGRTGRAGVGTGGMVTKVEAARIATGAGIPVLLTSRRSAAADALAGRAGRHRSSTGSASGRRRGCSGSRTRPSRGAGCTSTMARCGRWCPAAPRCWRPASPAWTASSPPATRSTWSTRPASAVARGLVNYDAAELPGLLGRSTVDLGPGLRQGGRPPRRPRLLSVDPSAVWPMVRGDTAPVSLPGTDMRVDRCASRAAAVQGPSTGAAPPSRLERWRRSQPNAVRAAR